MIYFDTSYLVRLYLEDPGFQPVRQLAKTEKIACSLHGRTELVAALHRSFRESRLTRKDFLEVLDQFREEERSISWLSVDRETSLRVEKVYREAGARIFLRAADAMHLACAAENGFREIYSNDRHLLAAAPFFGLKPRNVIA